jgi:hypothetical protein
MTVKHLSQPHEMTSHFLHYFQRLAILPDPKRSSNGIYTAMIIHIKFSPGTDKIQFITSMERFHAKTAV